MQLGRKDQNPQELKEKQVSEMFLNELQIQDRLRKGNLVLDPVIEETQLGSFTVDLRFGTEFLKFPGHQAVIGESKNPQFSDDVIITKLGQEVQLSPGTGLFCTTLEYIKMPKDLVGVLFSRSALGRIGITTDTLTVDPGFQGNLTIPIFNYGNIPATIHSGLRFLRIAFAQIEAYPATPYKTKYAEVTGPNFSSLYPQDLELLKSRITERDERLTSTYTPKRSIKDLLELALDATVPDKGRLLEEFAEELFQTVEGLQIIGRNQRLSAEELDLYLQNNINEGFWCFLSSPVIVECKNWSNKVGAKEISVLYDKLSSVGPDAKTAILMAPLGISGDHYSDAVLKIREKRQAGRYIILLDREALDEIASGIQTTKVIEKCYRKTLII